MQQPFQLKIRKKPEEPLLHRKRDKCYSDQLLKDDFVMQILNLKEQTWSLIWLQEILRYSPDIVCLQEVDHFSFLGQQMHFYFKKLLFIYENSVANSQKEYPATSA